MPTNRQGAPLQTIPHLKDSTPLRRNFAHTGRKGAPCIGVFENSFVSQFMGAIRGYTILTLVLASFVICGGCDGDRIVRPRVFPNEQASVDHFRQHQAAFQKLAIDWLARGTDSFCTFGPDVMLWHSDSISKSGHTWSMRVLAKDGWTDRSFRSLDEAAVAIGTTGKNLSNLQRQMLALTVECVKTVPITYQRMSGRYVECALPPTAGGYGFRFAPAEDAVSSQALARWASIPPPRDSLDMHASILSGFTTKDWRIHLRRSPRSAAK
jgi:hypothetical protein